MWHRRLGHLNRQDLLEARRNNIITDGDIKDFRKELRCEICLKYKIANTPFPKGVARATRPLDIIHSDVCGPMRTNSNAGNRYFVTFIDDHTKWCEVRFVKSKDEVFDAFRAFRAYIENQTGRKIKSFQSDNGKEFVNSRFDKYLAESGIKRRLATSYNPQQNGTAERKNRTLLDTARCLLAQSGLSSAFWAEAVLTANYIRNRCPSRVLRGKSPFEKLYNKLPVVKHFRDFGCDTYSLINKPNQGKVEPRSRKGIFLGYSENSKAYRVWLPKYKRVEISRDVRFVEDINVRTDDDPSPRNTRANSRSDDEYANGRDVDHDDIIIDMNFRGSDQKNVGRNAIDTGEDDRSDGPVEGASETDESEIVPPRRGSGRPRIVRTGTRGRPRKIYCTAQVRNAEIENCFMAEIPVARAMASPEAEEWHEAISVELKAIIKNDSWDIVDRPDDKKVIGSRVVLRNKYKPDGNLERRKARIVARGFTQRYGVDFSETFAPVARLESLRIVTALAAQYDMNIHQMDVTSAYLNGKIEETIYMEVPKHIDKSLDIIIESENSDVNIKNKALKMRKDIGSGDKVCLLRRALYGLKQAGRSWHRRLDDELISYGLAPSSADPCIYYRGKGEDILLVLIYVDDILIASRDVRIVDDFKQYLKKSFEVKDLGKVKCCLGIEFSRSKGAIQLHQRGYINDILSRFGMSECKPAFTPLESNAELNSASEIARQTDRNLPFRELMGSLMYLAVATRPDIAHAVSALSQFNNCYNETHWVAAKRILRYLKGTQNLGLIYRNSREPIRGYVDADWGNCSNDRRSFTGYVYLLADATVYWESRKQRTVPLSSVEAEYMGLSEATKEAIYLRRFLLELGSDKAANITLLCDNQGAIRLAGNPVFHNRTKHIDIRHHFVRDAISCKAIKLEYVRTEDMTADILTKGLAGPRHRILSDRMGLSLFPPE